MSIQVKVDPETWVPVSLRWQKEDNWPDGIPKPESILPDDRNQIWHLDGVPWHKAEKPLWWHRCYTQTFGVMNWFSIVERCPCGAIALDGRGWSEKNSRKR